MQHKTRSLLAALAIPLAVGGLSAWLTRTGMDNFYRSVRQPPLSPPAWLFPVAWTLLYLLMGLASWLVYTDRRHPLGRRPALTLYGVQLGFNFLWSLLFFSLRAWLGAFVWLVILWVLILLTLRRFGRIDRRAGWLLVPYALWVAFAGYLNLGVFLLN